MSEAYQEEELIAMEPGAYTTAVGIAMGQAEVLQSEGTLPLITLVFIDLENGLHPILFHPDGKVIEYLLSDAFRDDLRKTLDEIT